MATLDPSGRPAPPATPPPANPIDETQTQLAPSAPSAAPSSIPPPEPPLSTWGPFERLQPIGRGAFGMVYRAWDPRLERDVALKLLRPRRGDVGQGMLLEEARMMARVRHPNVVPVYGVEAHDGRIGFWSEFIAGQTLAALVAAQGPMSPREAALAGIEICQALGAVHAAGLLHQDIKAENVMREIGGRILLMDFGLSRLAADATSGAGTPLYMAPELLAGSPASHASDLYALGVLLFFLISGKFPYTSDSLRQLRQSSASTSGRTALLDARPGLPIALARAVESACHPDPSRRPASAGALGLLLAEALDPPRNPPSTRRRVLIGFSLALAAAIATNGYLAYRNRSAQSASQAPDKFLEAQRLIARFDQPGNLDRTLQLLNEVIQDDPAFALAFALRAQANATHYVTTRDKKFLDLAFADANQALALNHDLSPVYVTLGNLHMRTGKRDLAAQELQRAISLDPTNPAAHRTMAALLEQQGRPPEARASYQKAVDLAPDDWQNHFALGGSLNRAGHFQEALVPLQRANELAPDNPLVLNNLGHTYLQLEQFLQAETALKRAVAIAPRYLGYANLGLSLKMQGKYTESIGMFLKAVELNPTHFQAWGDVAGAYLWDGNRPEADKYFRKAIELGEQARATNPKDARLLALLANYKVAVGDTQPGLSLSRQAQALASEDAEILFIVGEAYELAGLRAESIPRIAAALHRGFPKSILERSPELAALRTDPRLLRQINTSTKFQP